MKTKKSKSNGFTMIILLISVTLVILLSFYAYQRTMKRVSQQMKEANPEMSVPAPTIENYKQTLDNVKQNVNDSVQKEQQRIDHAQE